MAQELGLPTGYLGDFFTAESNNSLIVAFIVTDRMPTKP
jgi:hypothetical protein